MSYERHPLELDPDVDRCSDCGNPWDYCDCPDAEAQRTLRADYERLKAEAATLPAYDPLETLRAEYEAIREGTA